MLRVSELDVRLAPADLRQLLQNLLGPGAGVTVESVAVDENRLRVRVRSAVLPAPVEVQAHVHRVEPEALVLGLDVAAVAFLPATWRQKALDLLGQRLTAPGVRLSDGQLRIAADLLAAPIASSCRLGAAEIRDGRLHLRLENVHLRAPAEERAAEPAAAEEPGAPEPAAPPEALTPQAASSLAATAPPGGSATEPGGNDREPGGNGTEPREERPVSSELEGAVRAVTGEGTRPGATELPPERPVDAAHQATYRRMRERVVDFLDRNLPDWLQPAVPWVLLLPDFIVLLARLVTDPAVSRRAKLVAGAALAYLALPTDILPDFIPGLGVLDDVALAVFALEALVGMSPPEVVRRHWPGQEDVLEVVRRGLEWTSRFFPRRVTDRLRGWLNEKQAEDKQAEGEQADGRP